MNLDQLQNLLWKLITAPEGVSKALDNGIPSNPPIKDSPPLSPRQRLDIYANMYFYRLLETLQKDYPAVLHRIGEERFHNLITDYLITHPPTHFSIRNAGEHLPSFLKNHSLTKNDPTLPDLARLEWMILSAFDAEDARRLNESHPHSIPADRWGELIFKTVPSLCSSAFTWNVDEAHTAFLRNENTSVKNISGWIRVWRKGLEVFVRRMDTLETKLLPLIDGEKTFASICEEIMSRENPESTLLGTARIIRQWIDDEMILL